MSSAELSVALPVQYWGLDHLFNSFLKLCICDVLNLKELDSNPGIYCYRDHLVVSVDIMGIIVRKDIRDKLIIYAVDDGTGVISCMCWKTPYNDRNLDTLTTLSTDLSSKGLGALLADMQKSRLRVAEGFHIGTLLHVRGNVATYNGAREIKARLFTEVKDPNMETKRMEDMLKLYQRYYDCPVSLPSDLLSDIGLGNSTSQPANNELRVVGELSSAILQYVEQYRLEVVNVNNLPSNEQLAHIAAKSLNENVWQNAVKELERRGHLCQDAENKQQYIVVAQNSRLHSNILRIIADSAHRRREVEGCHYLHMHAELRKLLVYSQLSKAALRLCLGVLESRSDIISTTNSHYIIVT